MDLYQARNELNMGVSISNIHLRVTYYSRVSTDHDEQKNSLKNQIDYFEEMIKNNNNWEYIDGYIDEGISGTTDYKRDNFMRMIEDARNDKFDLIITKEISRFSRNTLDSIKYTRELLSYGVGVLFINDNINTLLSDSELRLTIMASMAQDEIRRLSQRVKFGMKRSIKNGVILGNNMLYGYRKDKVSGNLVINEYEAYIVRRLFSLYAINNYSITKIVRLFNSEGIKTTQNKKWCTSTLSRMLKNPKYKGYYCGNKSEVVDYMSKKVKQFKDSDWITYKDYNKIPPIISEELWLLANNRLKKRNKSFGNFNRIMYQNRYPLSSKIICSSCNKVFNRRIVGKNKEVKWICSNYLNNGKKSCDSVFIKESDIFLIFDNVIKSLNIDLTKVIDILLNLYESIDKKDIDITELMNKKNKLLIKKEKLLELNIDGSITNSEFKTKNIEYNNEINDIDKMINNIVKQSNNNLKNIIKKKIKEEKEILLNLLLDKIVVSKINNKKNNILLEIYLNISNNFIND